MTHAKALLIPLAFLLAISLPHAALAQEETDLKTQVEQLQQKVDQMASQLEQNELEELVREAEAEAQAPEEEQRPEDREFLWGALALQKLNPEISVSADIVAGLILNPPRFYGGQHDRSSMPVREIGLHIQHALDPYSLFKSAICVIPHEGVELEEVYITWFGLLDSVSLTVGRFRHNFGVINRWHAHDLDQVAHPLAMQLILGKGGLAGNGISLKWFMPPIIAHANELTVEITDGENEILFAGELFSAPSTMAHLKNYFDLTENTYLELGVTGMIGFNNRHGYPDGDPPRLTSEPWRRTLVAGADLTIHWSPLQRAKYESFTWRSELYWANKEMPQIGNSHSWGVYSYIDYQLSTRWFCGARFDVALPTIREIDRTAWDIVPYVTFWQSEFVYLRLQYSHGEDIPYENANGELARRVDNRVLLQIDFAAGPHKHEKY